MGNFSVNHYSKLEVTGDTASAASSMSSTSRKFPRSTFSGTGVSKETAREPIWIGKAAEQARERPSNLKIVSEGTDIKPEFQSTNLVIADGAGNLPIVRITAIAKLDVRGANLTYDDLNFPYRSGWKENQ